MNEIQDERLICTGCGSPLQSEDERLPGFVPESAKSKTDVLCRRCFRIRNYGDFLPVAVSQASYQGQVAQIFDRPGLVLYVVDVFDLAGSLVPNLSRFVMNSDVVVVVNKVDLLPKGVYYEGLRDWITKQVEATNVNVFDVFFVSAAKQVGIEELLASVMDEVERPVYVVGMANTGKSTLLNSFAKRFGMERAPYTVSRRPGTTLALSAFTAEGPRGNIEFVDTPGLVQDTRVIDRLCEDCLTLAVPETEIRPRVYQLNPEQTLFLGGIARLDFESGIRQPIVLYVSNDLPVHRTKLSNKEVIWDAHQDDILKVPCPTCRPNFGGLKAYPLQSTRRGQQVPRGTLSISGKGRDIVIPGLGWITFSGRPFRGTVWLPEWIRPTYRPRLVGELSRSSEEEARR